MKNLLFLILVLSISSICKAQTDETEKCDSIPETDDGIEKEFTAPSVIKIYAPKQSYFLRDGKTRITHTFRMGFLIGKDEVMSPDLSSKTSGDFTEDVEEKTEQGSTYGLDLAYRLTFTPGTLDKKNQTFQINPIGFGYSFGINVSGDFQKNYGFSCDVLTAAGIEFGNAKIGFGLDGLIGVGNIVGFELSLEEDPEMCSIDKKSQMSFKYGGQIWLKIPSIFGGFVAAQQTGNDMRVFVRYIRNTVPEAKILGDASFMVLPLFTTEALQVGVSFSF